MEMISDKNCIIITTTMSSNIISEKRRNNIINNFSKYNIPVLFNHGIKKDMHNDNQEMSFHLSKKSFEIYKKTGFEYGIICDDDFFPCENFLQELNETVELLPENWRSLHLCPGYLWGRLYRDNHKIGKLNPEYNMTGIEYDESGRFYKN